MEGKQSSAKMGLGRYKYVPLILSLMSTLTLLVCIATDFWYIVELSSKKQTNEGLWRKCISGKCTGYSGGKHISGNSSKLQGTRCLRYANRWFKRTLGKLKRPQETNLLLKSNGQLIL